MATKFTVTLPDGSKRTRTSQSRTYTHAVAVSSNGGQSWGVVGWAGRLDLGEKAARQALKNWSTVRVIPVDQ